MSQQLKPIYEFGHYRLDAAERLLSRNGEVVPLQPKVFDLLLALVEHPGRLLEKDELMKAIWPDTVVEEVNLANNISILRKVLGDGGDGQRFIETIPKRGYRFVADAREVLRSNGDLAEEVSPVRSNGKVSTVRTPDAAELQPRKLKLSQKGMIAAKAALLVAVVALVCLVTWMRQKSQADQTTLRPLSRLTFDAGLQSEPTWSPDGGMIAYSSDRGGNFDIWVQQPGSKAVQVTNSPSHDWQPDWSPDGRQIVFRSERNGGGLYVIPALGGAEQKIASFGYQPRWSRDGSHVLFASGKLKQKLNLIPKLYVVAMDGSPPHEVLSEFISGLVRGGMGGFAWGPDSQQISIRGDHNQLGWGFWTIPLSGGATIKSEISPEVERRLKSAFVTLGNFLWAPSGRYLYFEGESQGVNNLWRITVEPQTLRWIAGPDRLTTSPGEDADISISSDGKKLALSTLLKRTRIWSLPFNPLSGQLKGDGRPETRAGIDALWFDVSRDGKQLAYVTLRTDSSGINAPRQSPKNELWKKSLKDGSETLLAPADEFFRLFPRWSPDGARLAYSRPSQFKPGGADVEWLTGLLSADGGQEQALSSKNRLGITDWTADGQQVLGLCRSSPQSKSQTCLAPISAAPHLERAMRVVAADPDFNLNQARFSPDERWIAIQAVKYVGRSNIYVMPTKGGDWSQVTDGEHWDDKPRWSPDGKTIYFISNRTGLLNVWGLRFDPEKGKHAGEPFRVTAFEKPSQMIFPDVKPLNLEITADRLFLNITEMSGSVWVLENVDR